MIELKKGDKCIVKGFTGIKLGVFEVAAASKKTITVMKRNGDEMIFDKKTGRQVNVEEGKEKYANSIMEDDGSYTAPSRGTKKPADKKPTKKSTPAPEPDDEEGEEDDEEGEEEEPKPAKKTTQAKKTSGNKKTSKKAPVIEEEEDDDDDFEEIDD